MSKSMKKIALRSVAVAAKTAVQAPASSSEMTSNHLTDASSASSSKEQKEMKKGRFTIDDIRRVVRHLNSQPDLEKGGLFHTFRGSLDVRLRSLEIRNRPYLSTLLQELGVARFWGKNSTVVWQVVCASFLDEILDDVWFARGVAATDKHDSLVISHRQMGDRVEKLKKQLEETPRSVTSEQVTSPDDALMAQVAGLMQDVEDLRGEIKKRDEVLVDVNRRLAEKRTVTPADVAEYLAAFRKKAT